MRPSSSDRRLAAEMARTNRERERRRLRRARERSAHPGSVWRRLRQDAWHEAGFTLRDVGLLAGHLSKGAGEEALGLGLDLARESAALGIELLIGVGSLGLVEPPSLCHKWRRKGPGRRRRRR